MVKIKNGTIVLCLKDVIMDTDSELNPNERMFTEGKYYRAYHHQMEDGWDFINTICAKNDMKERHIIIKEDDTSFFEKHFKIIEIN